MKLDLRKAYDLVRWEFVKELLISLNFPNTFTTWIMVCISTPTFMIHMNGTDFSFFKGGRRLRQRVPLSPLLFVLGMEYLSRLFETVSNNPGFRYHP